MMTVVAARFLCILVIFPAMLVIGCSPSDLVGGGSTGGGASTNADLSALTVDSGVLTPAFSAATTSYTLDVPNAASSITAQGTKADALATVSAPQTLSSLAVGVPQTATITVTAQSGAIKSYTIVATRAASVLTNADLGSLSVDNGVLTPAFAAATTSYTVSVANAVSSITVSALKADSTASLVISPAQPAELSGGANPITVTVTAGNTIATRVYTVTVTRAAPAAPAGAAAAPFNTTAVDLSWSAVPGATSYKVYRSTSNGVTGPLVATVSSPTVAYNDNSGLTIGTPYYYRVTALNTGGESTVSSQATAAPAPFISAQIVTNAADDTALNQNITVLDGVGGPPIRNATVTINGTGATPSGNTPGDYYKGSVPFAKGVAVTLNVTVSSVLYSVTTSQYTTYPIVSAPLTGSSWPIGVSHSITWTAGAPTSGAQYVVGIAATDFSTWPYGSGSGPVYLPTSTLSVNVPANTLSASTSYVAIVGILTGSSGGVPIPNAVPTSSLSVGAANVIPISTP
jgi:hypothetical protein